MSWPVCPSEIIRCSVLLSVVIAQLSADDLLLQRFPYLVYSLSIVVRCGNHRYSSDDEEVIRWRESGGEVRGIGRELVFTQASHACLEMRTCRCSQAYTQTEEHDRSLGVKSEVLFRDSRALYHYAYFAHSNSSISRLHAQSPHVCNSFSSRAPPSDLLSSCHFAYSSFFMERLNAASREELSHMHRRL